MKKRLSMSFGFGWMFVLSACGGGSTAMSRPTPLMITSTAAPAGSADKAYSFPRENANPASSQIIHFHVHCQPVDRASRASTSRP
jgi:ABC-type glycerol-3-phosphate transport system substrate-binding protein